MPEVHDWHFRRVNVSLPAGEEHRATGRKPNARATTQSKLCCSGIGALTPGLPGLFSQLLRKLPLKTGIKPRLRFSQGQVCLRNMLIFNPLGFRTSERIGGTICAFYSGVQGFLKHRSLATLMRSWRKRSSATARDSRKHNPPSAGSSRKGGS